jgi:hypothetical protein
MTGWRHGSGSAVLQQCLLVKARYTAERWLLVNQRTQDISMDAPCACYNVTACSIRGVSCRDAEGTLRVQMSSPRIACRIESQPPSITFAAKTRSGGFFKGLSECQEGLHQSAGCPSLSLTASVSCRKACSQKTSHTQADLYHGTVVLSRSCRHAQRTQSAIACLRTWSAQCVVKLSHMERAMCHDEIVAQCAVIHMCVGAAKTFRILFANGRSLHYSTPSLRLNTSLLPPQETSVHGLTLCSCRYPGH